LSVVIFGVLKSIRREGKEVNRIGWHHLWSFEKEGRKEIYGKALGI